MSDYPILDDLFNRLLLDPLDKCLIQEIISTSKRFNLSFLDTIKFIGPYYKNLNFYTTRLDLKIASSFSHLFTQMLPDSAKNFTILFKELIIELSPAGQHIAYPYYPNLNNPFTITALDITSYLSNHGFSSINLKLVQFNNVAIPVHLISIVANYNSPMVEDIFFTLSTLRGNTISLSLTQFSVFLLSQSQPNTQFPWHED
jgi:hypothetical protein